ncbi:MAG: cytochrome c-type biogenesis protein CcmH [Sphingomonadales bacterium]|nr:cytochrome c-type biogenesis protein CcmH [Sphingomonadales bacterium]
MKRLLLALALISAPLLANSPLPSAPYAYVQLEDPSKEAEAQALMQSIRCLQCQGQSIHDSDAQIAGDLRNQIRLRIKAGEKPEAIRAWLIERYGDYVSYAPRINSLTWPLFAAPVLLLGFAFFMLRRRFAKGDA